ncbi:MAG: FtsX-like permease family protein [Anaerolineae bacterium]|nr:FtsX-like permease family protein [Anaerolineae bacterium]
MGVIWQKVWFDLWGNKVRTLLAVLSIAAGVFAIGAIFGMVDQLLSGMDQAHQAVYPSHINMYLTDRIDRDTAIYLKSVEGVEDIEVMNEVTVRYKINPQDEWERGSLVMRDDYEDQTYDLVQLREGQWPEKDGIGIERLSSQYYKIDIGDKVIFELEKTDRALPITGKIRHPFVPPPQFGGDASFFASAEGMERFGIPEGEFGQLRVRVEPYSLEFSKDVASEIKDRLAKQNVGVAVTIYQDPEEHWGRSFMEGMNLVMQILAVVSLFMSAVLILNTLTALITQQTSQIGVLKAIGGTTGTVLKIYLAEVLVYGLLALLISLPLGAFTAFGLSKWFLNLFNIDYEVFQFSNRAIIYQVMAAIAAPLIAALWPVLKGATITVREAIASYGLGGDFGSSWLDRAVERIGQRFLPSHYAVALGNMFRRKGRLALAQLVLVTAGAMFLIVMSLSSSITFTLDNEFKRRGYDTVIYFDGRERIDRAVTMAHSLDGVEKAEVWFTQSASILREGQRTKEAGLGAEINGVPSGSEVYKPLIVAGRWLQPGDDRVIVMGRETADDNQIQLGDVVTLDLGELGDDDWQVVGLYQVIFGGSFSTDTIYAPQDAVFAVTKKYNKGGRLFVHTRFHSEEYVEAVTNQLKELYESRNMDVFVSQTVHEERRFAESQFSIVIGMLLALAVIVALVGGIGLMGSLSISVVERTREIGVMRAIGAQSGTMMGMFVMEGVLQGLMSWAIAVPISFILGQPLANALGQTMFEANLDYAYNFEAVIVWLVIILMISTLASILPARNATRISVRESLAYE